MQRHLDQWFDSLEDADEETGRNHLAHVIASACIVMDALKHGTLVDDRPRVLSHMPKDHKIGCEFPQCDCANCSLADA